MALTVTPTDEMKTLKVGEKIYEIVDDEARTDLNEVKADLLKLPKRRYMLDNPVKALFPEFTSKFWCSNVLPSALNGKQLVLTISGTEGDDHITPTAITPSDINISAITSETGVVLTTDNIEYEVYNIKYDSTTESLSIYPPLKQSVENATLAQFYLDAGENYTAMHLTEHGYRAYVYFLYNQNPKHCEVGLYNASFNAMYDTTFPFKKMSDSSSTPLYLTISTSNNYLLYLRNFYTKYFSATWHKAYTPYERKNGIYWDVSLNGTSGYLELLVGVEISTAVIDLPEGDEIYVDVYIDGELAHTETITNAVGRRICVDYENAETGRLEIYSNRFNTINGEGKNIIISKAVWWINELEYADNQKLFPTGAVVAMEFDSWGVFHNGVTGIALHDLINADAGCTVDFTNHSLGSQTTAWGMAYWYQNIKAYNPAIAITDFLINDTNSVTNSGFPDVIVGPDGKEYPNKITQDMYVSNIKKLIVYAVNNRIQPIVMRNTQITYNDFPEAVLNGISEQYTP